ncbi:phage baseplate assembly protein V [Amycolatopsis anabasis]|uniref:phage baseplate assembly protein V n=1 Tax=Amycolatopsis anabasis TaxID=1840409 RepID=UPI00131A8822|nr:phage baseplate assembly protein V [Amycolatopsis anabasis]
MTGLLPAPSGAVVAPTIKVGSGVPLPLSPTVSPKLIRAVVDTHLHLPDMFELTFLDQTGGLIAEAGLNIGAKVEIEAGRAGEKSTETLISGEVTSIEAICVDATIRTVVRGYEKAHRLQRARRTRTFRNMKDSDIAAQIAREAGLRTGTIDATKTTHDHLAQIAQTDWEFLTQRAREIGYEIGVQQGKLFFRRGAGRPADDGPLGAVAAAAGDLLGLGSTLRFKANLLTFLPRVSAANLTPDVEVRVWDAGASRVAVGSSPAATGTAKIEGQDPARLANSFTDGFLPSPPSPPALPPILGLPKIDFGTRPSDTAHVVVDRPLATGSNADTAATEAAKGIADHIASTFAEAEGDAVGDPGIQAGAQIKIEGVPEIFAGKWTVTNARHVFDPEELGYHTRFWVSGRQDRSLLRLASPATARHSALDGLVCGVVTNTADPEKQGRVKVALPWLAPNYESDWARVAQAGAGRRSGALFLPEVGDEVLIGFEFGDARRPYVLGGLINEGTGFEPVKSAVNGSGTVTQRGLTSPAGNRLRFTDELLPGPAAAPVSSSIVLGTADDNLSLSIDQVAGKVTLTCKPSPPASKNPAGSLTIDCSGAGSISIKGGVGGVKVESDGRLELSGKAGVQISSPALVEVSGSLIKLN